MVKQIIFLLCTLSLVSCGTMQRRASEAYVQKQVAEYSVQLPDLPDFCWAESEGVTPKVDEKWRWVNFRWEVVLENINNEKRSCKVWYESLQQKYSKKEK